MKVFCHPLRSTQQQAQVQAQILAFLQTSAAPVALAALVTPTVLVTPIASVAPAAPDSPGAGALYAIAPAAPAMTPAGPAFDLIGVA